MFSNDTAVAGLRCGCSIVCNFGRPDVYSFGMSFQWTDAISYENFLMRKEWELFTNSLLFRHINLPLLSMFYLQKYFNIFNARINASTPNIPVVFLSLVFFSLE